MATITSSNTPSNPNLNNTTGAADLSPTTPIRPSSSDITGTNTAGLAPNEAASKLVEAIDDFLGDIEKKFKGISEEILGKLDEMAERCDRLEQEMLMRETGRSDNNSLGDSRNHEHGDEDEK